ncbi:hypothetical protein HET69_17915 [Streptomyces sp. CJ_13]|uniref:hypothetical protein n=1 Tax=Streptomyces sp. CJ_13 TaxID=2724943 RepID=UPI001BDC0FC4|nr:hypothetical protein [Streptomyces sp. CJ_13]MBT1185821.1 hypothetical protein [Streptomyces sp. CJ_13]
MPYPVEVFEESGQTFVGDRLDHARLDRVDVALRRVQAASPLVRQGCRARPAGFDGGGRVEQPRFLESAQDDVHGLAGDEGGAGEVPGCGWPSPPTTAGPSSDAAAHR